MLQKVDDDILCFLMKLDITILIPVYAVKSSILNSFTKLIHEITDSNLSGRLFYHPQLDVSA